MRLLAYGPGGWLVELAEPAVIGYARAVERARHTGVGEVVPGARTVLVHVRPGASAAVVGAWLRTVVPDVAEPGGATEEVEIAVSYDGADLGSVAAACGMSIDEVVARHVATSYVSAFCGFAPGFAYLRDLDPALRLPRRPTPRTRVPAGAVAVADRYTAIYPSASPGGWHLIGHTDAPLWDPGRDRPALIAPGTAVRFVAA
jgi:KipI family sensor histidine kinase inhibitor